MVSFGDGLLEQSTSSGGSRYGVTWFLLVALACLAALASMSKKGRSGAALSIDTSCTSVASHLRRRLRPIVVCASGIKTVALTAVAFLVAAFPRFAVRRRRRCRVLLLGLDNAGKTTICHRLLMRSSWPSQPRPGHHVLHTTCSIDGIAFDFMDPSGDGAQTSSRENLWTQCLNGPVDAVAVVVDASDHKRLPEAKSVLKWLFRQDVVRDAGMPILILGSKVDSVRAVGAVELQKALGLMGLTAAQRTALLDAESRSALHMDLRRRIASFHPDEALVTPGNSPVTIRMCCASHIVGVHEAMMWLAHSVKPQEDKSLICLSLLHRVCRRLTCLSQRSLSSKVSVLSRCMGQVGSEFQTLWSSRARPGISHFGRHARLLPTHVA